MNGVQLYYEIHGAGRPLVLLHGGFMTIDLNWGPLLEPLAATRQVIAVELHGHGRTADTDRPMTIDRPRCPQPPTQELIVVDPSPRRRGVGGAPGCWGFEPGID